MRMLVEEGSAIAPLSARFARASNCVSFALALLKGRAEQLPPAQAFELLSVVDNVARMQPRLGEWVARQSHYADPRSTRAVLEDALRFQAKSLRQLVQLSGSMGWTSDARSIEIAAMDIAETETALVPRNSVDHSHALVRLGNDFYPQTATTVPQHDLTAVVAALSALTSQVAGALRALEAHHYPQVPAVQAPAQPRLPSYPRPHPGASAVPHAVQHFAPPVIETAQPVQRPHAYADALEQQVASYRGAPRAPERSAPYPQEVRSAPPPPQPQQQPPSEDADYDEEEPSTRWPASLRIAGTSAVLLIALAVIGGFTLANRLFVQSSVASTNSKKFEARLSEIPRPTAPQTAPVEVMQAEVGEPDPAETPDYGKPIKVSPPPMPNAEGRPAPAAVATAHRGLPDAATPHIEKQRLAAAPPIAPPALKKTQLPAAAKVQFARIEEADVQEAEPANPVRPAAARPTAAPASAPAGSQFVPVLSTHKDKQAALAAFSDLSKQYRGALGDKKPDVQSSGTGQGTWHRLVLMPAGSRDEAADVCAKLRAAGYSRCWVKPL